MFEQLLNFVPDGVLAVDEDGYIMYANQRAEVMFDYPHGRLIGRPIEALVPDRFTDHVAKRQLYAVDPHDRLMGQGRTLAARRRDGSEFPSEIALANLETPDGKLHLAAVRDVSDRAASERELRLQRELDQARRLESVGQLAGGIAHDFNNLLAIIINLCDFVSSQLPDDTAVVRADIDEIRGAAQRGAALTRQLLIFSRRDTIRQEALALDALTDQLAKLLRRALGERVDLQIRHQADLWTVIADRGQLEQVLVNLAVNGRDAMPDGGTLTITTRNAIIDDAVASSHFGLDPGAYVRITVTDTGTGMPPEVVERAFEPFFTTKPQGQGTGLGLATAYGIVTESGGHIAITSEVGVGTEVTISLPAAADDVAKTAADEAASASGGGETLLVVEDEDQLRHITERILRDAGYAVLSAPGGAAALELWHQHRVDLLVTDVVMPGLVGPELASRLREQQPDLRVLYVSGYDQELLRREHHDGDPRTTLLEKPFTADDLLHAVRGLLDRD